MDFFLKFLSNLIATFYAKTGNGSKEKSEIDDIYVFATFTKKKSNGRLGYQ